MSPKPIEISIAGSKSITNRALILASLSKQKTTLNNVGFCDDTELMIKNLEHLGVKIKKKEQNSLEIEGPLKAKNNSKLYTGDTGTTTRFLTALSTILNKKITIDGSKRMRERPIAELLGALNKLGAKIHSPTNSLPLKIEPKIPQGGKITLNGNITSQYLSAVLMIAPFLRKKTIINIEQELYSRPYIEITLNLMKKFSLRAKNKKFKQFIIEPKQKITCPKNYTIESDASSASYIGAYTALHPGNQVCIKNLNKKSIQGDIRFLNYLKKMGCKIKTQKSNTIINAPKNLKCLGTIDMNQTPDLVMTFAVLAIFTPGKTRITNIANLRIKETDRLSAMENEIKKLGIKVKTGKDYIEIEGNPAIKNPSKKILIKTYNDHRIAMSFGIIQDLLRNLVIEKPNCVSKSYTNFWGDLKKLQSQNETNIVLTGLRGSGKTQLGKLLATKLKMNFIDLDEEIEKHEKKKIKEIVELKSWKYFRALEKKITKQISTKKNTVISTGGGTIIDPKNEKALKQNGKIIYLHVKPKICAKRILNDQNRPPLTNKKNIEEIKQLYKERNNRYCESANIIFKRTESLEKDANSIIEKL